MGSDYWSPQPGFGESSSERGRSELSGSHQSPVGPRNARRTGIEPRDARGACIMHRGARRVLEKRTSKGVACYKSPPSSTHVSGVLTFGQGKQASPLSCDVQPAKRGFACPMEGPLEWLHNPTKGLASTLCEC